MTLRGVIVSFIMTIVLSIMVLGYAALQQRIDIQGEATVDSTYRVEITRVQEGTVVGNARSTTAPQYNGLNASFYVGLTNTTDTISYNIEITNYSTVDIKLNELSITVDGSNYIKASKIGISNGDIMLAGSTKAFTVKIKLETATSSEQIATITVNPQFTRLKGGTGNVVEEVYDAYEIGDVVSFAGRNWYVIEDSGTDQDYVTLLKADALTKAELGEYARSNNRDMPYYWSETCHVVGSYGYETTDSSGCRGHNDYEGSKVKEYFDNVYLPTIGEFNLKEIDGYKIRLITTDEIINNLGWTSGVGTAATTEGNTVPTWVYNAPYWTMTPVTYTNDFKVYYVQSNGQLTSAINYSLNNRVRPVINLYKTAID